MLMRVRVQRQLTLRRDNPACTHSTSCYRTDLVHIQLTKLLETMLEDEGVSSGEEGFFDMCGLSGADLAGAGTDSDAEEQHAAQAAADRAEAMAVASAASAAAVVAAAAAVAEAAPAAAVVVSEATATATAKAPSSTIASPGVVPPAASPRVSAAHASNRGKWRNRRYVRRMCREMAPVAAVLGALPGVDTSAAALAAWPANSHQDLLASALRDCRSRHGAGRRGFHTSLRYRRAVLQAVVLEAERNGGTSSRNCGEGGDGGGCCEGLTDALMSLLAEVLSDMGVCEQQGGHGALPMCYVSYSMAADDEDEDEDDDGEDAGEEEEEEEEEEGAGTLQHVKTRSREPPTVQVLHVRRAQSAFGETGLAVWGAALMMGEFARANAPLFQSRRVLELGAGTGLAGLVVGACSRPAALALSDFAPVTVQNLRHNVAVNARAVRLGGGADGSGTVQVHALDWATADRRECAALCPDVVLAADCVYDIELNGFLARALHLMMLPAHRLAYCGYGAEAEEGAVENAAAEEEAAAAEAAAEGAGSSQGQSMRQALPSTAILVCAERTASTLADFRDRFDKRVWQLRDVTARARAAMGPAHFCYGGLLGDSGRDRDIMHFLELTPRAEVCEAVASPSDDEHAPSVFFDYKA